MLRLILTSFFVLTGTLMLDAASWSEILDSPELWGDRTAAELAKEFKGFRFLDKRKVRMHVKYPGSGEPSYLGYSFYGVDVNCAPGGGAIEELTVIFYTRGDGGKWEMRRFNAAVRKLTAALNERFKGQPERSSTALSHSTVFVSRWSDKDVVVDLRYSSDRKSPEYLMLEFHNTRQESGLRREIRTAITAEELRKRAVPNAQGATVLDVPMVDQGRNKGYCAAAVAERMMRYYNADVDQNLFAQIFDTDPSRGTNSEEMMKLIKRCGPRLGYSVDDLYRFDGFDAGKAYFTVQTYNRFARRRDLPAIRIKRSAKISSIPEFDQSCFQEMRLKRSHDRDKFVSAIESRITQGIPLCWAVLIFPDDTTKKTTITGHLRIINGCNPAQKQLIYTDSWGTGHEAKPMSYNEAWGITTRLFVMKPRTLRPGN